MVQLAAVDHLTVQEKLLLSQAVYKVGAANWPAVSKLLLAHPCIVGRPTDYFTPEACESSYVALMGSIEINVPAPEGAKPQARVHLQLARTFYFARMEELKHQIANYEQRFTELMREITAIKAGELDDKIHLEIRQALAKRYGKSVVDSWAPLPSAVKAAVEAGPESAQPPVEPKEETKDADTAPATTVPEIHIQPAEEEDTADTGKDEDAAQSDVPEKAADPEATAEDNEEEAAEADSIPTDAPTVDEPSKAEDEEESVEADKKPEAEEEVEAEKEAEKEEAEEEADEEEAEEEAEQDDAADKAIEAEETAEAVDVTEDSPAKESDAEVEAMDVDEKAEEEDEEEEADEEEAEEEAEEDDDDKEAAPEASEPTTPKPTTPSSPELSPASELSPLPGEDVPTDAAPSSPTPVTASTRGRKRKAGSQPGSAPVSKRSNRKGASPAASNAGSDDDEDAEVKEEADVEVQQRGRRASRRGLAKKEDSPPPKRGQSASSAASGTPTGADSGLRRRGRPRVIRDDVVTKAARGASEAASVKDEQEDGDEDKEEEDTEEPEEEKRSLRTSGRRKPAPEVATPTEKRGKRGAARTPRPAAPESAGDEGEEADASPAPAGAGPSTSTTAASTRGRAPRHSSPREQRNTQKLILSLLDTISQHKFGPVFSNPVKKSEAADYYDIIKRPMDLKTIRARIKDGTISTIDEFERDIRLMFANATVFNARGSQVYNMAREMLAASEGHIAHYKSMQHHLSR